MTRSEMMANIGSKATGPELAVRKMVKIVTSDRCRYNFKGLPGKPDIFVPARNLAIFVHGCFWHGCDPHYKTPKTNSEFWERKITNNAARDRKNARRIRRMGLKCLTLWEHELFDNRKIVDRIQEEIFK